MKLEKLPALRSPVSHPGFFMFSKGDDALFIPHLQLLLKTLFINSDVLLTLSRRQILHTKHVHVIVA